MTRTRLAVALAIVVVLSLVGPMSSAAARTPGALPQPQGTVSGPTPVPAPPEDFPAGDVCPFAVHVTFPVNRVVAYTYTDGQGRLVAQYFTGALTGLVTRPDTGQAITVDLSGSGVEVHDRAGNATLYGVGPYLVSLHAGDSPSHELAQPSGLSELRLSASGTKTLVFATHVRNLCTTLG